MKKKNYFQIITLLICAIFQQSCTQMDSNDTIESSIIKEYKLYQCPTIPNSFTGVSCCVSGPLNAYPNDVLSYNFNTNLINPTFEWKVVSGSMQIVSGKHSSTVEVKFGSDFTEGKLVCFGASPNSENCSSVLNIAK